ncbi:DUF4469 domain-containing protein [Parabacteroides sp. TM07-1AC]|uniref:DUF4469 domain-containing protein n=1 Tax=Parabacteroides sp. TM07-1AC TaxID=2292363 RepID=UPI000EFF6B23|nr:DUF4469 domain-containing protein [Parabacteroides sp. TM07-1AC]RHU27290.1 DUF4469 domain-containing protein [Parabacteroides sp. TM07-1AC]
MATKKYVWKFDLEEYLMTKDVLEDYKAILKPIQSLDITDVARAIVEERTEYRVDTLVNTANLIDEKIRQLVCQNNIVKTGTAMFTPAIEGLFLGKTGTVDPAKNKCTVNIIPTAAMRSELDKVTMEFSGTVKESGGARIGLVKDVTTGKTDGTITPGGMIDVTGSKIRCINADGTGIGSLTLLKSTDRSVATSITLFGINDPSRLMFTLPANLEAGTYELTLETYFSTNKTQLKQPRTLVYSIPLVVGGGSSGGGDDRPEIE